MRMPLSAPKRFQFLHDAGFAQCSFRQADLTVTEHVDEAPFDLVFARLLMFHIRNPADAVRRR